MQSNENKGMKSGEGIFSRRCGLYVQRVFFLLLFFFKKCIINAFLKMYHTALDVEKKNVGKFLVCKNKALKIHVLRQGQKS